MVHIMTQSLVSHQSCKHDIHHVGSDSIFVSAGLCFANQFSESVFNAVDTKKGFASLCEPSLTLK